MSRLYPDVFLLHKAKCFGISLSSFIVVQKANILSLVTRFIVGNVETFLF